MMTRTTMANSTALAMCGLVLILIEGCGQNRVRQMVPTKNPKKDSQSSTANQQPADNNLLDANRYNPQAGSVCVRENCPTVDIQLQLTGPLSQKVNGFIAEAGSPVQWALQILNNANRRMAVFPDNSLSLHPISGTHIQGSIKQTNSGLSSGLSQSTGNNSTGTPRTGAFSLTQQTGLPKQDFSAFRIDWPNPGKAEGFLTFTVRDLDQCEARSKDGAQVLCTQFNQPNIVDRSVEVPFKVDKGILVQTKDEGSMWETLAACLVTGVLNQANIDGATGAVIRGVARGFFGQTNSSGCYGGVARGSFYQSYYKSDDYTNDWATGSSFSRSRTGSAYDSTLSY